MPDNLKATQDIINAVHHGELILMVIPTPFVEKVIGGIVNELNTSQLLCSCTKGILNEVSNLQRSLDATQ